MKRALATSSIVALTMGLSATPAVAHPCPCFPPGEWVETPLPPVVAATTPWTAGVVGEDLLLFATDADSAEWLAFLVTLNGSADGSPPSTEAVPIDLSLAEGADPAFLVSDATSPDVLIGGSVSPPDGSAQAPFLQHSPDGGRTWTEIDLEGSGLDIVVDGTKHGDGFAISGATDVDGSFHPAFTIWDGEMLSPAQQLGSAEGYGITIASGTDPDTISVGGVTFDKNGKQRPALFTFEGGEVVRVRVPGSKDAYPVDILSPGDDIVIRMSDRRVLHSGAGGDFAPLKGLNGSMILALGGEPDSELMAFDDTGLWFSLDGGDTWARSGFGGLAEAGTVKATGVTDSGDFFALSRGEDEHPHLFLASSPGSFTPIDALGEFATMMAGFLIDDLVAGVDGVPTRLFVLEVTDAMHDAFDARADGNILEEGEEGSAQRFGVEFLDRLEAAGGSGMTSDFLFTATSAILDEYDERTGSTE